MYNFQASGNKVSRQSVLCGSQNIVLNGKVSSSLSHTSRLLGFAREGGEGGRGMREGGERGREGGRRRRVGE